MKLTGRLLIGLIGAAVFFPAQAQLSDDAIQRAIDRGARHKTNANPFNGFTVDSVGILPTLVPLHQLASNPIENMLLWSDSDRVALAAAIHKLDAGKNAFTYSVSQARADAIRFAAVHITLERYFKTQQFADEWLQWISANDMYIFLEADGQKILPLTNASYAAGGAVGTKRWSADDWTKITVDSGKGAQRTCYPPGGLCLAVDFAFPVLEKPVKTLKVITTGPNGYRKDKAVKPELFMER